MVQIFPKPLHITYITKYNCKTKLRLMNKKAKNLTFDN